MDRFRPGLDNEEFPGKAIFSPFNVHRLRPSGQPGIMVFYQAGPAGQFQHFFIGQGEPGAVFFVDCHTPGRMGFVAINQTDGFFTQPAANYRLVAGLQSGFEDNPFVRGSDTLDYKLTQTVGTGHNHRVPEP